jgi:hypothetical protein
VVAADGDDAVRSRVEVGLAIWDVVAAGHAAMTETLDGAPVDDARVRAAVQEPAARALALGKDAPLEVRRALRDLDEAYLAPLAAGTAGDPAETLSHIAYAPRDLILSIDGDAIPGMPPELK